MREMSEQREKERCIKERCTAIVLAAGSGKRMGTSVKKQYLLLNGKPVLYYALKAFEDSERIQRIILVTGDGEERYCKEEIVETYGFQKVSAIVTGGRERYHSVWNGLNAISKREGCERNSESYIFIHDGARPFLTEKILEDTYAAAVQYQACVAAVQSKDTVKISDGNGFALSTPDRRSVWNIQTPQVFETSLILQAYERLKNRLPKLQEQGIQVTDDASVVEMFTESRVKLVEASYQNIKITTPEDMKTAEAFLEE